MSTNDRPNVADDPRLTAYALGELDGPGFDTEDSEKSRRPLSRPAGGEVVRTRVPGMERRSAIPSAVSVVSVTSRCPRCRDFPVPARDEGAET